MIFTCKKDLHVLPLNLTSQPIVWVPQVNNSNILQFKDMVHYILLWNKLLFSINSLTDQLLSTRIYVFDYDFAKMHISTAIATENALGLASFGPLSCRHMWIHIRVYKN